MILHRAHFVTKSGLVPGLVKQLKAWDVFLSLCSEPSQRLVALRGVPTGMNHGAKCRHSACAANSIRTSLPSQRGVLYGTAPEKSLRPVLEGNLLCSSCQRHKHAEGVLSSISVYQGNFRRVYVAKVNVNSLVISKVSFINPFWKCFSLFHHSVWCLVCLAF